MRGRKRRLRGLIRGCFGIAVLLGAGWIMVGVATPASASPQGIDGARASRSVTADRATALGREAYLYGLPLLEFERTLQVQTSVRCPDALGDAPVNSFSTVTHFPGPSERTVVAPNVDTLYSIAHLDLARGPVVLSHPAMGHRYFVFELLDPYTNVISYIGSRTTGSAAGRFAITWTAHPGHPVPGTKVITSKYRSVWVIGRTLAGDRTDQRRAVALMRRYTLTPPSGSRTFSPRCQPGHPVSASVPSGLGFLDALSSALTRYPPPGRDAALLRDLRRVGVGPGRDPQHADLPPAVLTALMNGVIQEAADLPGAAVAQVLFQAVHHDGWYTPPASTGAYGTNYFARAEIAAEGLGANTRAEASYPIALTDSSGQLLNGASGSYELVFRRHHIPPVRAFWSLTMYSVTGYLVPNAAHRYSIGSSHPDLRRQPDGDIVVILSHTHPTQHDVNWLPAPAAPFRLNLRLYWPRTNALNGRWQPPPITELPPA